ncbi:MAG: cadherin-like domain-containing protein, partial [Rhodospirillales bacterium]|nr:cadherin-like domain-containing protein [Rhodospirillales bacterium]
MSKDSDVKAGSLSDEQLQDTMILDDLTVLSRHEDGEGQLEAQTHNFHDEAVEQDDSLGNIHTGDNDGRDDFQRDAETQGGVFASSLDIAKEEAAASARQEEAEGGKRESDETRDAELEAEAKDQGHPHGRDGEAHEPALTPPPAFPSPQQPSLADAAPAEPFILGHDVDAYLQEAEAEGEFPPTSATGNTDDETPVTEEVHINQGPEAESALSFTLNEDGTLTISEDDLLQGVTDADGDELSVTNISAPGQGALTDNGDGTWTFTPADDWSGELSLSYTVEDGHGGSVTNTADITVEAVADSASLSAQDVTVNYQTGTNDNLTGTANADTLAGGAGNDTVNGAAGDDTLYGDAGNGGATGVPLNISATLGDLDGSESLSVTLSGFPAGAQLSAGAQNDDGSWTLTQDQLSGLTMSVPEGSAAFHVTVNATSSEISGDQESVSTSFMVDFTGGNDTLTGGAGNDAMYGGAGNDSFVINGSNEGTDQFHGGAGTDTIRGAAGWSGDTFRVESGLANLDSIESIDGGSATDTILAGSGNDTLDFGNMTIANVERIDAGAGDDTVTGTSGADTIIGNAGND